MQVLVEIARDTGENHGLRLVAVDEMLRGGGGGHQTHAAHRGDDVHLLARVGGECAARDGQAGGLVACGAGERGGDG